MELRDKETPAQRMANALVGGGDRTLQQVLDEAREAGESYERISRRLSMETGGVVDVSGNTLRNWHRSYKSGQAA